MTSTLPARTATPAPPAQPAPVDVADAVLAALAEAGVSTLFGFPGETSLPLYLAAQRQKAVRHVLARCPRCAGYMADGYARISGETVACDAPGGIGSPFTTPALLEAYNSSTSLVFLASGVARASRGRWTTGECDQQQLFGSVTKHAERLEIPAGAADRVAAAVQAARAPRSGPVLVEIPADVLTADAGPARPMARSHPPLRPAPEPDRVREAAAAIRAAGSAVIVAGGGSHRSAMDLRDLITATGLPVATTLNGKGAVDERLPNALGVTGAKGSFAANDFVRSADVVIAIGTKLGDKSTDKYRWPHPDQLVVHVDSDPAELTRYGHPSLPVLADAGLFCRALAAELAGFGYVGTPFGGAEPFWDRGLSDHLCARLTAELGSDDIVVADASVSSGWAGAAITLCGENQRLLTPRGSGSLGFALPAALGARYARPGARVFAIGGDGGLAMAMHELETAVRLALPITYFLLNNQSLGLIDKHATDLLGGEAVSTGFAPIDWQQIAAAFGWRGARAESTAELDAIWDTVCDGAVPTLVELVVPADEGAPDFIVTQRGEQHQ